MCSGDAKTRLQCPPDAQHIPGHCRANGDERHNYHYYKKWGISGLSLKNAKHEGHLPGTILNPKRTNLYLVREVVKHFYRYFNFPVEDVKSVN